MLKSITRFLRARRDWVFGVSTFATISGVAMAAGSLGSQNAWTAAIGLGLAVLGSLFLVTSARQSIVQLDNHFRQYVPPQYVLREATTPNGDLANALCELVEAHWDVHKSGTIPVTRNLDTTIQVTELDPEQAEARGLPTVAGPVSISWAEFDMHEEWGWHGQRAASLFKSVLVCTEVAYAIMKKERVIPDDALVFFPIPPKLTSPEVNLTDLLRGKNVLLSDTRVTLRRNTEPPETKILKLVSEPVEPAKLRSYFRESSKHFGTLDPAYRDAIIDGVLERYSVEDGSKSDKRDDWVAEFSRQLRVPVRAETGDNKLWDMHWFVYPFQNVVDGVTIRLDFGQGALLAVDQPPWPGFTNSSDKVKPEPMTPQGDGWVVTLEPGKHAYVYPGDTVTFWWRSS